MAASSSDYSNSSSSSNDLIELSYTNEINKLINHQCEITTKEMFDTIFKDVKPGWKQLFTTDVKLKKHITIALMKLKKEFENGLQLCNLSPSLNNVFEIFKIVDINEVNCVILGQDPYPTNGIANGLSFSVNYSSKIPMSLRNIFKANIKNGNSINSDSSIQAAMDKNNYMTTMPKHGNLIQWAEQGILLMNKFLTTANGMPKQHTFWDKFTNYIIKTISITQFNVVFILWGNDAQKVASNRKKLIDQDKHLVLKYGHPSPLAAKLVDFENCPHFRQTNDYLDSVHKKRINWNLTNEKIIEEETKQLLNKFNPNALVDVDIFTDGSAVNNGKSHCKAAWAFVLLHNRNITHMNKDLVDNSEVYSTSPRAELTALLKSLIYVHNNFDYFKEHTRRIRIYIDMKYALDVFNKWAEMWNKNNTQKENMDLVNQILKYKLLIKEFIPDILAIHVRSHTPRPIPNGNNDYEIYLWINNDIVDKEAQSLVITNKPVKIPRIKKVSKN